MHIRRVLNVRKDWTGTLWSSVKFFFCPPHPTPTAAQLLQLADWVMSALRKWRPSYSNSSDHGESCVDIIIIWMTLKYLVYHINTRSFTVNKRCLNCSSLSYLLSGAHHWGTSEIMKRRTQPFGESVWWLVLTLQGWYRWDDAWKHIWYVLCQRGERNYGAIPNCAMK